MSRYRQDFLAFAMSRGALRFGRFVTKAGRETPYFFNTGLFSDGESLRRLGQFYAGQQRVRQRHGEHRLRLAELGLKHLERI